mgnify:FL=1
METWLKIKKLYLYTVCLLVAAFSLAEAAPYADMVMDARSGKVLRSRNADTRLHPASLTKMMTLYIAFEAIENGEIDVDKKVKISRNAANERPSKLGLRVGQKITLRLLLRAAAVKSANDAATAIGEAISGSEAAFARRMNRTAKSLGMTRTTFKNAHGLTEKGHLSTARDMTVLGRHLMYDFPGYYPMFKRKTTITTKKVRNTNRKFLAAYKGADGIKTGYTRKAGFNLVASAERNGKRVIATVFGGKSTRTRNIQVAKLLDLGFERTLENVELIPPMRLFQETPKDQPNNIIVVKSLRPKIRTDSESNNILLAMALDIAKTVKIETPERVTKIIDIVDMNSSEKLNKSRDLIVVSRDSSPQIKNWKVNLGFYKTKFQAEKSLLKAALHELSLLEGAKRKVINKTRGFEATFSNLTKSKALKVCVKLLARNFKNCQAQGPT